MPSTSLRVDRTLVASAIFLTCALFTAKAADPVNVIKLTVLLLCAIGLVVLAAYRATRYRVFQLPWGVAALVTTSLLAGLVAVTATAPVTATAIYGTYGRNSGLLAYAAAIGLFLVVLRSFDRWTAGLLLGGVVGAGAFTASYGLLQRVGADSVAWSNPFNPIIAGLGNPNFASGYLGIAGALAVGGAFWAGWDKGWRVFSGCTGGLCTLAAALSSSVQGPIALLGGLAVVSLSLTLNLKSSLWRARGLMTLGGGAALALGVLLVGAIAEQGPASGLFQDYGSRARVFYWHAAWQMFRDEPFLGVGLDHYGNFWRSARSPASVELLGNGFSDAAHSVPLQMLAQGGLVLGVTYTAFVTATGLALIRGLITTTGVDRVLLGAVGGGWTAYQVQSLVSIDQVPLLVLHFALAGGVFVTAGFGRLRAVRLPGAPGVAPLDGARPKRRGRELPPPKRKLTPVDSLVLACAAAAALVGAWHAATPLRASVAVQHGDAALARGNGDQALAAYRHATEIAPGQSLHWLRVASIYRRANAPELAFEAYRTAVSKDPYEVNGVKAAAGQAEAAGDLDEARDLFRLAVDVDPLNAETIAASATFELRHAGAEAARQLLESAVDSLPGDATLWATLGDARLVLDDHEGARSAYERALELNPVQAVAKAGLANLARPVAK